MKKGTPYYLTEGKWKKNKPIGTILFTQSFPFPLPLLKQHPSFIQIFLYTTIGAIFGSLVFFILNSHITSPLKECVMKDVSTLLSQFPQNPSKYPPFWPVCEFKQACRMSQERKSCVLSSWTLNFEVCDIPQFQKHKKNNEFDYCKENNWL